ncbi:single-stranded DNA-binding protein [Streptomyces sp. NPDC056112]|uniref:single-stranded DNA-binding protein n=1 Tax=Streptomyces sp. NPDC056112 TaxID=3345715 RepID=UPI0035D5D9D6
MSLPNVNGTARLIEDPQLRYSASGSAVVTVRLAFNSRKKDQSGQWVDDATCFLDGKVFGQAAENLAESVARGLEVVVSGRLKTESWEQDGAKRSKTVLLVDSIGPALRYATAKVSKASGGGGQGGGQRGGSGGGRQGGAPAEDPWAQSSAQGGQAGGWGGGSGGYSDEAPF